MRPNIFEPGKNFSPDAIATIRLGKTGDAAASFSKLSGVVSFDHLPKMRDRL
jgi:hypothetical protein